ncbi:MAG: NAD-dependent succinate-semialdehyde dehydrogenase [Planctomycetota bacterium]
MTHCASVSVLDLSRIVPALIGGETVLDGGTLDVRDPATDAVVASVASVGEAETTRAIDAARDALASWSGRPVSERAAVVRKLGELMLECQDELALLMTREQGKPLRESRGEIAYAASFLSDAADRSSELGGTIEPSARANHRILTIRKPIGVCGIITPWNFPSAMITRKLGPALVAGNTAVVKPAELTPLSALAIGALAGEAGVPAGVVNIVVGEPGPIGRAITSDARVRKLSFTGSTAVGRELIAACAPTVKRVSMELGGHAPFIVFDDADLDRAVAGVVASKFRNGGQTCICANRVLVHESVHDAFVGKLASRMGDLSVGVGTDEATDIGPLVSDAGLEKVERHVADARARGGAVVAGGERVAVSGAADRFYAPTLITGMTSDMLCAQEETFGPVAPVRSFSTEDEAIDLAHDTEYGLAAYFDTRDPSRLVRVAERLEYGIIGANDALPSAAPAPVGGFKQSGLGREGGAWVFAEYTETSYVSLGV